MADVTSSFLSILRTILPDGSAHTDGAIHIESPFYRSTSIAHGGYDFFYTIASGLNGDGHPPVYSPITGEVIFVGGSQGAVWIKDSSGFVHRILHLDEVRRVVGPDGQPLPQVQVGDVIAKGTYLGDMGNTGVTGNHVHYDILLPGAIVPGGPNAVGLTADQIEATWNKIDPQVFWTPGLNPRAPVGPEGELTGTGLLITSTALRDTDGNGTIDTQGYLEEGQPATISVEVNTPHTRELLIRVQLASDDPNVNLQTFNFSSAPAFAGSLRDATGNPVLELQGSIAYFAIPQTADQTNPNTLFQFQITPPEDNANFAPEVITYSIDAGFFNANNQWESFQAFNGLNDHTLFVLDNDIVPDAVGPTLFGNPGNNTSAFSRDGGTTWQGARLGLLTIVHGGYNDQGNTDGQGNVLNDAPGDLVAAPDTAKILGLDGHDVLIGNDRPGIVLEGGAGHDILFSGIQPAGGPGAKMFGGADNDVIFGSVGNDLINGGLGNDVLDGGTGNDRFFGSLRDDFFDGGDDHDFADSYAGDDTLLGGFGNDALSVPFFLIDKGASLAKAVRHK